MNIPLFILFLAGTAVVLLLAAFIIAMMKLFRTRTALNLSQIELRSLMDTKAKLSADLAKVTQRKERYKKISLDLANEMIITELDKADLKIQVEQLRNQKLRGWDVPDGMGPTD